MVPLKRAFRCRILRQGPGRVGNKLTKQPTATFVPLCGARSTNQCWDSPAAPRGQKSIPYRPAEVLYLSLGVATKLRARPHRAALRNARVTAACASVHASPFKVRYVQDMHSSPSLSIATSVFAVTPPLVSQSKEVASTARAIY